MTGIEAYDSLKHATSELPAGSEFTLHTLDAYDLYKLTSSDLQNRGYSEEVADRVSADLLEGRLEELGKSMMVRLAESSQAARLEGDN